MSEVEKLYRNAGINMCTLDFRTQYTTCDYNTCNGKRGKASCGWYVVPPLAPEKQLELIKWLSNFWVHINKVNEQFNISTGGGYVSYYAEDLADAIALYINSKWNNLTEQERTEIRSILNG